PHSSGAGSYLLAAAAGVAYAGVIPITIAMAQRLLPHRTSLASGLMMGSWALAGLGPILAQALYDRVGLAGAFGAIGGVRLVAGAVPACIPGHVIGKTAHH